MEQVRKENQEMMQKQAEMEAQQKEKDAERDMLKAREGNKTEIDVAKIYVKGKNQTDQINRDSQERIKAAELAEQSRQKVEGGQKPQPKPQPQS